MSPPYLLLTPPTLPGAPVRSKVFSFVSGPLQGDFPLSFRATPVRTSGLFIGFTSSVESSLISGLDYDTFYVLSHTHSPFHVLSPSFVCSPVAGHVVHQTSSYSKAVAACYSSSAHNFERREDAP